MLLHAGICDSRMWEPQWDALCRDHRVLRLDLAGFGRSPLAPGRVCHAEDVLAAMDAHGIDSAVLIGASFGGAVALDLAVARPDRIDALVLLAPALGGREWSDELQVAWEAEESDIEAGDLDAAARGVVRFWVDGPGRPAGTAPQAVRELVAEMQQRAYELQLPVADHVEDAELAPDAHERLGELALPVLIVIGDADVADFQAIARDIAAQIPGAGLETIAGAAHLPSMERPEQVTELVRAFLGELRG